MYIFYDNDRFHPLQPIGVSATKSTLCQLVVNSEYLIIIITGDITIGIIHPVSCQKGLGLVHRKRNDHGIVL